MKKSLQKKSPKKVSKKSLQKKAPLEQIEIFLRVPFFGDFFSLVPFFGDFFFGIFCKKTLFLYILTF